MQGHKKADGLSRLPRNYKSFLSAKILIAAGVHLLLFFTPIAAVQVETPINNTLERIIITKTTPITETFVTFPYLEISRLGDYARGYLNAKWIAEKLGVPIVLRPFPHSSKFKITENLHYQLHDSLRKDNFVELTKEQLDKICKGELTKEQLGPGIFTIPFPWEYRLTISRFDNLEFFHHYIDDFQPLPNTNPEIILPREGKVNIAIHVRDGGAFDILIDKFTCPDRFPSLSFYDRQLERVLTMGEYRGMDVHIQLFTDALEPEILKDHFLEIAIKFCHHVTIDCRANDHDCDATVVSDLLSLSKYPIVIRSNCYFSWLASFLGQPALELYPYNAKLNENGIAETNNVRIITRFDNSDSEETFKERHVKEWPNKDLSGFDQAWHKYREMFGSQTSNESSS